MPSHTSIRLSRIFFLIMPFMGFAQEQSTAPVILQEALTLAASQNNKVLKSVTEKEIAEEEVKEAGELRLPELDFHTSYARISSITEFTRGSLEGRKVTHLNPNMYDFTLSGSMPLYQGNRINNLIDKARMNDEAAAFSVKKTIKDARLQTVALYLGIYKLMQLDKLLSENVEEEKERLKEVQSLHKNGTVTKNEVLRAELQLRDRELSLLNNHKDMEIAYSELKTVLQLPEEQPLVIDTLNLLKTDEEPDFVLFQNASLSNEEIKMAQQRTGMSLIDVKNAKANYYPVISLYGNYAYKFPNYMFFPPDPYAYTFGQVGVQAVYNISGLYKNKSRVALAKKKAEAAARDTAIVVDEMRDRIFRQYRQYLELQDKFKVTDAAEALAAENYRLVKLQYLNQLVVITEMIDADNELLQARYNRLSARIDAAMKYYEMRHTAGLSFTN